MRCVLVGISLLVIAAGAGAAPRDFEVLVRTSTGEPAVGATVNIMKGFNVSLLDGEESMVKQAFVADEVGRARLPLSGESVCVAAHLGDEAAFVCSRRFDVGEDPRLELTLEAAVTIRGRIEAEGELVGAKVRATVPGPGGNEVHGFDATVEEDGSFRLPPIPRSSLSRRGAVLEAIAEGHLLATLRIEPELLDAPVTLALQKPRVLTGRVVDQTGKPVAGARVLAYRADDPRFETPYGEKLGPRTGPDGRFRVDDAPPVSVLVYVVPEDHAPLAREFAAGKEPDLGDLVVQPGQAVQGVVLTTDGLGIVHGGIVVRDSRGFPVRVGDFDRDGTFRLGPVGPGEYGVVTDIHALDGVACRYHRGVRWNFGDEPLRLVFSHGLVLKLRDAGGKPVRTENAWVEIECASWERSYQDQFWHREGYSELRLDIEGPTVVTVTVTLPGLEPVTVRDVRISAEGSGEAIVRVSGSPRKRSIRSTPAPSTEKRDELKKILLPDDPTEDEVREYVDRILATTKGRSSASSTDPETAMLRDVGPDHAAVLVEKLAGAQHGMGGFYIHEALKQLATEEHRPLIIGALEASPRIVDIVFDHGWCEAAREVLCAGIAARPGYLPPDWIRAVATFRDPATYPDLTWYLVHGQNVRHTLEAIEGLPGIELENSVAEGWQRCQTDRWSRRAYALVALQFGHVDALVLAAEMLAFPESDRRRRPFRLREIVLRHIDFKGGDKAIREWVEKNRDSLEWDAKARRFRAGE